MLYNTLNQYLNETRRNDLLREAEEARRAQGLHQTPRKAARTAAVGPTAAGPTAAPTADTQSQTTASPKATAPVLHPQPARSS